MVARRTGKPLPEAGAKLVDAMQFSHVASWGRRDADGSRNPGRRLDGLWDSLRAGGYANRDAVSLGILTLKFTPRT
jgi:hypothetical protein